MPAHWKRAIGSGLKSSRFPRSDSSGFTLHRHGVHQCRLSSCSGVISRQPFRGHCEFGSVEPPSTLPIVSTHLRVREFLTVSLSSRNESRLLRRIQRMDRTLTALFIVGRAPMGREGDARTLGRNAKTFFAPSVAGGVHLHAYSN